MITIDLIRMVARADFRPFTETDWHGFAGCENASPRIATVDEFVVVEDGEEHYSFFKFDESDEQTMISLVLDRVDL